MKYAGLYVLSLVASAMLAGSVASRAAESDNDKVKAYEDRIKSLEQHVRELENKLDEQSTQSSQSPRMPRERQFSRDRFEEMMRQMQREMESGGAFGFGPGFGPNFGPNPNLQRPRFPNLPGFNNHMRLGVELQVVTPELAKEFNNDVKEGVFVHSVVPGSPAEKAGIVVGDAITHFDDKAVRTPHDLIEGVKAASKGKHDLTVSRRGQPLSLKVELGAEVAASDRDLFPNEGGAVENGSGNAKTRMSINVSALELPGELSKEMKLSEAQTKQVRETLAKHARALSDEFTRENQASAGGINADLNALANKHAEAAANELAAVLNPEQLKQWNDYRHSHNSISFSQSTVIEGGDGNVSTDGNVKTQSF